MRILFFRLLWLSLFLLILQGCKKEDTEITEPVNIVLWDKPLSIIQNSIVGNWITQYSIGSYYPQKIIPRNNPYMILDKDHITIGNDSSGIDVDTSIIWIRTKTFENDSTYLLTYQWHGNKEIIVEEIKNDTLLLRQNNAYGFTYYLIRKK